MVYILSYELNNQMSEQIPSILITLTVFDTSVTIYSNDLTRTKNKTLKNTKKNLKSIKKHNKKFLKTLKNNKIKNMLFILL